MKDICIIGGAGHIGLPLAVAFADVGFNVLIHDINKESLATIKSGVVPFKEDGVEEPLRQALSAGKIDLTNDLGRVKEAKFVVVTIGTPVDEHLNPTYHTIKRFFENLCPYLTKEQVVILRSTVFPRTTSKIRDYLAAQIPGIEVCFCPERIAEGRAWEELRSLPQIVSGFNPKTIETVSELFRSLTSEILVIKPEEAELAKLFNNSWRYLEFAAANQFYMIANNAGADFYAIYKAMTHNYPRAKSFPKPGFAAGPCLFKDTMQVSAFAQNNFFLGHSAMLINEGFPNYVVEHVRKLYSLSEMRAGILGMAFKAENDDIRESLSYKLRKTLEIEAKQVLSADSYISATTDATLISEEELIAKSDIIFIGVPHKRYKHLDLSGKIVVDVWSFHEGPAKERI